MRRIKESDWKYLRSIQHDILNRHCDAILESVDQIIQNRKGEEHNSYIQIYNLIKDKDMEIAAAYNDIKRSNAIAKIVHMRHYHAMTDEEFSKFSDETKNSVNLILSL